MEIASPDPSRCWFFHQSKLWVSGREADRLSYQLEFDAPEIGDRHDGYSFPRREELDLREALLLKEPVARCLAYFPDW